jgi:hypothetical protein
LAETADEQDFADRDCPVQALFADEQRHYFAMRIVRWRENYLLTTHPVPAGNQEQLVGHNEGRFVSSVLWVIRMIGNASLFLSTILYATKDGLLTGLFLS